MDTNHRFLSSKLCLVVSVASLALVGCSSSNDGDLLSPAQSGLQGTWEYLVTNAYDARFSGCTGDAIVLEGATLVEGLSLAPICMTAVSFDVTQAGEEFQVPSYVVTCSDGATATVSGFGEISNPDLGGQWESVSSQGVEAVQAFTGVIVGNTIQLAEHRRTFGGAFGGACDFSPPLTALVTIQ